MKRKGLILHHPDAPTGVSRDGRSKAHAASPPHALRTDEYSCNCMWQREYSPAGRIHMLYICSVVPSCVWLPSYHLWETRQSRSGDIRSSKHGARHKTGNALFVLLLAHAKDSVTFVFFTGAFVAVKPPGMI